MVRVLKERRFLVGLSIDGPRELHDRYRITKGGRPTFDLAFGAAKLLKRHGVPFNTLTCVHPISMCHGPRMFTSFCGRNWMPRIFSLSPSSSSRIFKLTAPQKWDATTLPKDGDPEARPGHPNSIVTEWSVDPDSGAFFVPRVSTAGSAATLAA